MGFRLIGQEGQSSHDVMPVHLDNSFRGWRRQDIHGLFVELLQRTIAMDTDPDALALGLLAEPLVHFDHAYEAAVRHVASRLTLCSAKAAWKDLAAVVWPALFEGFGRPEVRSNLPRILRAVQGTYQVCTGGAGSVT